MRADARVLLERLGKQDFAYKEFADRFADLELWPIFEALLKDQRLFTQSRPDARQEHAPDTDSGAQVIAPAPTVSSSAVSSMPLSSLFARYEAEAGQRPTSETQNDVRSLLRQLSEANAKGAL
ncbi:MAG TPA: hypothetical protein VEZ26_05420 [Sphingomonadaceae bacterium]|nr:hypothetical protein [Sphingomonadaceae bacterium]